MSKVLFLNCQRCELCEADVARLIFEGLWVCEGCASDLEPRQPPAPPPRPEPAKCASIPLEEIIDTLLGGPR